MIVLFCCSAFFFVRCCFGRCHRSLYLGTYSLFCLSPPWDRDSRFHCRSHFRIQIYSCSLHALSLSFHISLFGWLVAAVQQNEYASLTIRKMCNSSCIFKIFIYVFSLSLYIYPIRSSSYLIALSWFYDGKMCVVVSSFVYVCLSDCDWLSTLCEFERIIILIHIICERERENVSVCIRVEIYKEERKTYEYQLNHFILVPVDGLIDLIWNCPESVFIDFALTLYPAFLLSMFKFVDFSNTFS